MANTIQIKRSTTNDAPATDLAAGELAFSELAKKLYVGTATQGNFLIGGEVGLAVQGYDANLVSDATYVATDVNFSTTLNTKLANIEANATADQTQADINALNVNAATVSGFSVGVAVPATALFTDTTYTVGDGGLSQKNFTTTLASKLDGIAASANNYALPVATDLVSGGVKVGLNLTIDGSGVLSADAQAYTLPAATTGALGGVQVGSGLAITAGGLLSATGSTVGVATTTVDGLMSSVDKTNHDSVYSWYSTMTTADSDNIINTINEVFAAFSTAGESLDVAASLGLKLDGASTIDGGSY